MQKAAATQEIETFEIIAREWYVKFSPSWATSYAKTTIRRLELFIFPWLGTRPIKTVTAPELLAALRRIGAKGALETAHRVKQVVNLYLRLSNRSFVQIGCQSFIPCPEVVCPCGLRLSSGTPLPISAGLRSLSC